MTNQPGFASVEALDWPSRGTNRTRFDERPQAVRAWLDELPLVNLGETGRRVHDTLCDLHTIGLSSRQRLDVLGLFDGVVTYLINGLRSLYQQQPLPLTNRGRNAAILTTTLCEEMTRGYRLCLLMDKGGITGLRRKYRAQASLHVCRYAGTALLESWLRHGQPPPGTWATLHEVWKDARQRHIHQKTISVADGPRRVDDIYKQLLLTEAANPWRMPRGEVLRVYNLLGRYAGKASLLSRGDRAADKAVFAVDQSRDKGPGSLLNSADREGEEVVLIVTEGLSRSFNHHLRMRNARFRLRRAADESEIDRIRRLITALGSTPHRHHARKAAGQGAALVIGLSHVHRILLEKRSFGTVPSCARISRFHARELKTDLSREEDDIWSLSYVPGPAADPDQGQIPPRATADTGSSERFWTVTNSSSGGYCLSADGGNKSRAQVGELVILTETGDTTRPNWQTGVIRWIKGSEMEGTQMGVQLIAPCPHPVFTRAEQPGGRLSDPSRCLLIPAMPEVEQPVTLVTPLLHYSMDRRVYLMGKDHTGELHLTGQVEDSGLFRQFTFRRLGSVNPADTRVPDYQTLWSSI
ncbi:MAG: hypothetical protein WED00_15225 [Aquisalimonadaceae bacterium]